MALLQNTAFPASQLIQGTNQNTTNTAINALLQNTTEVTSAAGNTVLTVNSLLNQILTGTTTQTFTLPDATTLFANYPPFVFTNNSTGVMTINANGGGLITTLQPTQTVTVTCTNISSAPGIWLTSVGNIVTAAALALKANLVATPTANHVLLTNSSGQPIDSGLLVTTTLGSDNTTLPTSEAIQNALTPINSAITAINSALANKQALIATPTANDVVGVNAEGQVIDLGFAFSVAAYANTAVRRDPNGYGLFTTLGLQSIEYDITTANPTITLNGTAPANITFFTSNNTVTNVTMILPDVTGSLGGTGITYIVNNFMPAGSTITVEDTETGIEDILISPYMIGTYIEFENDWNPNVTPTINFLATSWNSAISNLTFVTPNGNDATGQNGNPYYQFASIQAAVNVASSFGTIEIYQNSSEYGDCNITNVASLSITGIGPNISAGNFTASPTNSTGFYANNIQNIYWNDISISNSSTGSSGSNTFMDGAAGNITYSNTGSGDYYFGDSFYDMEIDGNVDFFTTGHALQTTSVTFLFQQCTLLGGTINIASTNVIVQVAPDCIGITPSSFTFANGATIAQVNFLPVPYATIAETAANLTNFIPDIGQGISKYQSQSVTGGGTFEIVAGVTTQNEFASITVATSTNLSFALNVAGTYEVELKFNYKLTTVTGSLQVSAQAINIYTGSGTTVLFGDNPPVNSSFAVQGDQGWATVTDQIEVTTLSPVVVIYPTFTTSATGVVEFRDVIYTIKKIA